MTWAFLIDSVPFTRAVVDGQTSLGGSESSCVGLARALQHRGHHVHVFVNEITDEASGPDADGVTWHPLAEFPTLNLSTQWDVVVPLRMFSVYAQRQIDARLRLLWCQDLLVPGTMQNAVMGTAWAVDHYVYVSAYHQAQWETLQPDLAGHGWATRNGYDPGHLPATPPRRDPSRIIHTSRPERGLAPLLAMWPEVRRQRPQATLQLCRYSSMYDQGPGSWSDVCARYDAEVAAVQEAVGGITVLGELTKPQLYQAMSEAAVVWYPGVSTFGETSCIAAIEAQACGTPFVGSYRGALPETVPSGVLIRGGHTSEAYQRDSVSAVVSLLDQARDPSVRYRRLQQEGRAHVRAYTYAALAQEWEAQVETWFRERYETHTVGVLRQLLHDDDHVMAKRVAVTLDTDEGRAAVAFCDYVMAGKDHTSEQYAEAALPDAIKEARESTRMQKAAGWLSGRRAVLDVACGNGAFAIALALADPTVHIHGLDYAAENVRHARAEADRAGVGDRCTFETCTVYDYDAHDVHADWRAFAEAHPHEFDGLFVGEFLEHVANYQAVIDGLEDALTTGAQVIYTCPVGPLGELLSRHMPHRRGHVHRFYLDDLSAVFGGKLGYRVDQVHFGHSQRGHGLGNWIIRYEVAPGRLSGPRPWDRIPRTRPMPRLSVGLIVKDAEHDLGRCLESVWPVADEIIVGDTGSTDRTKAIAAGFQRKVRVIDVTPVTEQHDGFAGARNDVLDACAGDWFLWVDADEILTGGPWLRRYLDTTLYQGYVIPQTHLYLDGPPTTDIPVRLFRRVPDVRFYGCIHEQPQKGDCNGDIIPTLRVPDIEFAHTGYLTQDVREEKRVERNLPLLLKDAEVFPDRVLGHVLRCREAVLQADAARGRRIAGRSLWGGEMTPYAEQGYRYAVSIFIAHFDDPAHKYHALARPWYEAALRHLGLGWEQELGMAGRAGGMGEAHAKLERIWVRDGAEYQRLLAHKAKMMAEGMAPAVFVTDPDALVGATVEDVEGVAV